VRISRRDENRIEAFVPGTDVEHRVVVTGEGATCTCPWHAKHGGERGPCKHILAVQVFLADEGGCR
jgi:uncharacterized Zn finger protein